MNANELADYLQNKAEVELNPKLQKAAAMLRQQQAEIEALKASHIELERGIVKDLNQRQSVEPVAWRNLCVGNIGEDSEWIYNEIGQGEPLYTHPAKTLTDEEITEVLNDENIAEYHQGNWLVLPYAFARAILRKAQEK